MNSKELEQFELKYCEVSLQHVMDHFAKGFDVPHIHRMQFFINPITNKVMFELFVRKEKTKEIKTDFGSVSFNPHEVDVSQATSP